jgi:hypothetical protein
MTLIKCKTFDLEFFIVGVYQKPLPFPYMQFVIILWNWEFNLYKEQIIKMNHSLEGSNANAILKWRHVKEVERTITPKDLETINFIRRMHGMIWFVEKREASWVKKADFIQLRKFD